MTVDYRVGDTRQVVATLPDGTVSLVASSPPFVALRSYLPDGHPDKANEIGSEPDPATFLDTLLGLTAEWGRVLAPWGSIAIELGDTYAGSGGAGGDYKAGGWRQGQGVWDGSSRREQASTHKMAGEWANPGFGDGFKGGNPGGAGWPRAKSLALIPQLYATSLAYGRNLLTGQPSPAGQWLVRNVIVWHRPNPAVGALGDKVRPSTSYITVATRSPKRWFDLDAVRQPYLHPNHPQIGKSATGDKADHRGNWGTFPTRTEHPAGAPPLDCWFDQHDTWTITTQPSSLAHYAMWPARLAERLILMMCPEQVCATCGTPRQRITESQKYVLQGAHWNTHKKDPTKGVLVPVDETMKSSGRRQSADDVKQGIANGGVDQQGFITHRNTTGWSDCGHGSLRCRTCKVVVPFEDAVRGPRESKGRQAQVSDEALLAEPVEGAGEQASVPGDVRGVRGGVPRPGSNDPNLFTQLLGEAGAPRGPGEHDRRDGSEEPSVAGRQDDAWRLRDGLGAAGHAGPTEERLHDGASAGDAGAHRPALGTVGDRAPQERRQGRQPDRQPGDRDAGTARRDSGVSTLPEGVHDQLTCRHCGGTEIEYVADHFVPGTVLDPFAGTGTTIAVADLHGRDAIGIDLDERNRELYPQRRDECARALFGTRPQMAGQLDMFGDAL